MFGEAETGERLLLGDPRPAVYQIGNTGEANTSGERESNSHLPRDYLPASTPALDL